MNKKAMEISAAFLVSVIVAIAFFGLALTFGLNAMKGAEEYSTTLSEQTMAQTENMLDTGHDSVVMPFKSKKVLVEDLTLFAVGIRNIVDDIQRPARAYRIVVEYNLDKSTQACGGCNANWIKMNSGSGKSPLDITVNPKQNRVSSIGIQPPSGSAEGTYAFDVKICYDNENANNNPSPLCSDATYPDFYTDPLLIKAIIKN
jgi:hypothetical protein